MANMIGSTAFFYLLGMAAEGLLSASGPPDEPIAWLDDERPPPEAGRLRATMEAAGWRRDSIKLTPPWSDKPYWINYSQWGPLGYMMGAAAALGETYRYGLAADRKRPINMNNYLLGGAQVPFSGRAVGGVQALYDMVMQGDAKTSQQAKRRFFGTMLDMSYLNGLADLSEMVESATKWATVPEGGETPSEAEKRQQGAEAQIRGWAAWTLVSSLVPGSQLLNTIAGSQDPYARGTEFGSIPQAMAARLPTGLPSPFKEVLGSPTGTREGLPIRRDVLGRPVPNEYAGVYGWLPFRAQSAEMSTATLDTLLDAGVGASTPPSELYFKVPDASRALMIRIPSSTRQTVATMLGKAADERIAKELAAVPEAQRRADPAAWSERLKTAMSETYFETTKAAEEDPAIRAQLARLAGDSSRTRWAESKKDREAVKTAADKVGADGTLAPATPGAAPRATATPGAAPAPASSSSNPDGARDAARDRAGLPPLPPSAPRPAAPAATPAPAAAPPTGTPRPIQGTPTPTPAPAVDPGAARKAALERAGIR